MSIKTQINDRQLWEHWDFWHRDNEPLPDPDKVKKHRKITLFSTCMGRAHDLKKTLLKNIVDNADYPNLEILILNYNSSDDLEEWMKRYISPWIEDGIVTYYKTTDPEFYEMGHSRNVAYKLASGDIVNNVDADNYTGLGFAEYVNRQAEVAPKNAVFAKGKRMMHGRLGMYRNEFFEIGGYDEDLTGYGYDDHWLQIRAMEFSNKKFMWWGCGPVDFSARIKTPRGVVGSNMREKSWKKTENANKLIALEKFERKELVSNLNRPWGAASVSKNFSTKTFDI